MDTPQNGRRNGKMTQGEADAFQAGLRTVLLTDAQQRVLPGIDVLRAQLRENRLAPSDRVRREALKGEAWARRVTGERVAKLSERQMIAFLRFYWGEESIEEIAADMDASIPAVKNLLKRARRQM